MRTTIIALAAICLAGCTAQAGSSSAPSPAIVEMERKFEAAVLAAEPQHRDSADDLRRAAEQIAVDTYGKDWAAVRAEAQRSIAALPELDLKPYETAAPSPAAMPPEQIASTMREAQSYLSPGGMAMMRFWDARMVGGFLGPIYVRLDADGEPASMIGMKLGLVPGRTFKGAFKGENVLAARYMRSLVIAPYTLTTEGMILPQFAKVSVFAYLPPQ